MSNAAVIICEQCHSMKTYTTGLKLTPHIGFNCYKCHEFNALGVANEITSYIIYNPTSTQIAEKYSPIISMYKECISCHPLNIINNKMIHQTHIQVISKFDSCDICHNPHSPHTLDSTCIDCHKLADTVNTHQSFHVYAMSELNKGNDEICLVCHSKNAKWQVEICPESILGLLRGYQCFDCHQPPLPNPDISGRRCTDCHAR